MNFLLTYHPFWILIVLALAIGYSFALYYREKILTELKKSWRWLLASLRFLAVFIIGILLLNIIFEKLNTKAQKPILFIAHDQSESIIQTKDSTFYKTDYLKQLKALKAELEDKFEWVEYGFSNVVNQNIDTDYSNKLTDISQVLNQIYDQYSNRNIGAIILSTDGIYNKGQNPIYTVERKPNVPVFTIGLGDTTVLKDLLISDVVHNDIAFYGNEFPIQVNIHQNGFEARKVKVSVLENGKLIQSEQLNIIPTKNDYELDFTLKANSIGYQKYTVKISPIDGEFTYKNNIKNFYMNIIDGRQKILLTYSNIHPDIAAINYVIKNNDNYDLDVKSIEEIKGSLQAYNLIIIHNYQNKSKALAQVLMTNQIPILNIIGLNTDIKSITKANIGVGGIGDKHEDISFSQNADFNEIIFSPQVYNMLGNAPPLTSPQGNIHFSEGIQIIGYQKIGNISLSKPLVYVNQKANNKYAVIFGEGVWRWRLYDQMKNESTDNFELFISKLITYLAVKENKDPFKINCLKEYEESDKVVIKAELYNATYDLVNDSEVKFNLTDENGKSYDNVFYKTSNAYQLDLGNLSHGIYTWQAKTEFNKVKYQKKGVFLVKETKRELLSLSANHRLLKSISTSTNGLFFLPNKLNELKEQLLNREDIIAISYQEKTFDDLIDYKWILFLIIALLIAEWFIRKFQGGY